MSTIIKATIEDLYQVRGKNELVDGEIVHVSPTVVAPNYAASEILISLHHYCHKTGVGMAVSGNAAFRVNLPIRGSFSPDVAYHTGKWTGMKFFEGAPVFAVEVRSESDYGARADVAMAIKRADYFAAGTLVVWDVDLLSDDVVNVYHRGTPEQPTINRRGDIADAEPAVPGWTMPVDDLFPDEP